MDAKDIPEDVRDFIIKLVIDKRGITGKELMLALMAQFLALENEYLRPIPAIMAQAGLIMEIEYIVPGNNSRSFFLPRGTVVMVGPNFTFDGSGPR